MSINNLTMNLFDRLKCTSDINGKVIKYSQGECYQIYSFLDNCNKYGGAEGYNCLKLKTRGRENNVSYYFLNIKDTWVLTDTSEFCNKDLSNELNKITKEKMNLLLLIESNK